MYKYIEKVLSWTLIGALTVQPALLHAQSITVVGADNGPRPRVDQSYNGTTVLNINTPNGAGVSHDIYTEFTADDLILNNSATNVDTQLGGWVEGNPNLTPGNVADLWIGEVIGGNQTQLNGILEVGGQSMDVILANEFGITCNGCGFINTNRTTLTTGTPRFGADGALAGFDVKQGTVQIGAGGLNPEGRLSLSDTSRVDVIARAAQIYGAMRADQINVVAGANVVDYNWSYDPETGAVTGVTEQAGVGAAPTLAVDVSALGGMYANAITMVATEHGVGVRLDGELASSSDIALRADGRLTLGAPTASHTPQIKASNRVIIRNQGPLVLEGSVTSEDGQLIDIRTNDGTLTFSGQADGGAITLESAGTANITGVIKAAGALQVTSLNADITTGAASEIAAGSLDLNAATSVTLAGKASANGDVTIDVPENLTMMTGSEFSGDNITLKGQQLALGGVVSATDELTVTAGSGGLMNSGTLTAQTAVLTSDANIGNTGTVSAGQSLTLETSAAVTNAATLISGDDLAIYADQVVNNGGVIWANDSITLAANDALGAASLVQNTNGRIEAFQGDLTIRADEVANIGTAPGIIPAQIIKWLEEGNSGPTEPVAELSKLIDPAYLDGSGNILPAHAAAYTALWADVISGAGTLSAEARSILKPTVMTPSGTTIKSDFAGLWEDMYARANADGVPDPAQFVADMVDPAIFDASGAVLPAHAQAYADLWTTLASGGTTVSDDVKAILLPAVLEEEDVTDPNTGVVTTTLTNDLLAAKTGVWAAMSAGSGGSYDIVNILYQDRFDDTGKLAELVAGGNIDIEASGEVQNIFGNISAGEDIMISAASITNQAMGASQILLEVHKKPGCFVCHKGETDFYDTFGGQIEAVGNATFMGSLSNVTLNSSELTLQDVIDQMNTYIEDQKAAGDADLAGVSKVAHNNLEFHDSRDDEYTAPVAGVDEADRKVTPEDTGANTTPAVAPVVDPTLAPTASVEALLSEGLNTIAETNPEFTDYANYITSNYMMDVDRLQYRDDLINNTTETISGTINEGRYAGFEGNLDYLNRPVSVPAPDGSGLHTIYPAATNLELNTTGALIKGNNVTVSGANIDNSGAIQASAGISVTGNTISGSGGSFVADGGAVALTALAGISFEDTVIDGQSVDIISGQDFVGKGVAISSETDTRIYAATGVTLTALEEEHEITRSRQIPLFIGGGGGDDAEGPGVTFGTRIVDTTRIKQQQLSTLDVGGNLSIISSADMVLAGVGGDIAGNTSLSATGNLELSAVQSEFEYHGGNAKNGRDITNVTSHVTDLNTGGDFTATAGGSAVLVGTQIDAGGTVQLAAAGSVVLTAAQDIEQFESRRTKSGFFSKKQTTHSYTRVTNEGVRLAASGDVDVVAETGDLTTAGTAFASANGDINLSAVQGDILAGAYEDIFQETIKKSRSMFFGLISKSSERNTLDRFNTGTEALAELDLNIVSGGDTTLVGADLAAGNTLNINTGGDFSVQAAIDSQKLEFFSTNAGLVTMTTIQESSYVETPLFTQLLAGQGLNFGIGGEATLAIYEQAGVDLPALEDLYPEELLALEGLKLLESQELANEYFYDKQTTLSPAFKALVAIVVAVVAPAVLAGMGSVTGTATAAGAAAGTTVTTTATAFGATAVTTSATGAVLSTTYSLSALGTGVSAFASSTITGTLNGVVSGDFDLGDIIGDATFSGLTAGLTAGINLDGLGVQLGDAAYEPLLGFGKGNLSFANLLEKGLDNVIRSGLNTAVYGTDFGDSFLSGFSGDLLTLAQSDLQNLIGLKFETGSAANFSSHIALGCLIAEASGADCSAGVMGALTEQLYVKAISDSAPEFGSPEYEAWKADHSKDLQLISGVVGWVFSGGEAENVNATSDYATSAFENNYLSRPERERADKLLAVLEELKLTEGTCGTANCFVSEDLIEALQAAGVSDHGLSVGYNSFFVVSKLAAVLEGAVKTLQQASIENTKAMASACSGTTISADCGERLDDLEAFLKWDNVSSFDGTDMFNTSSSTLSEHLEWGRDLDAMYLEEFRAVQAGEQSLDDAKLAIITRASAYDGKMNVLMGAVTAAGATVICLGSVGLGCGLVAGAAVVGQGDETVDGVVTWVNGVPTQNPTEAALIAAGATPEQARRIEGWIDQGAALVELSGGVLVGVKGGQTVGREALTGPRVTANDIHFEMPDSWRVLEDTANASRVDPPAGYRWVRDEDGVAHLQSTNNGRIVKADSDEFNKISVTATGRPAPLVPRVDVSGEFRQISNKHFSEYKYGNPDTGHGLNAAINNDGILGFDIQANASLSASHGSGRDMFNSLMNRLEGDGVVVNGIRGQWNPGQGSRNHAEFEADLALGMSRNDAAANTWTGKLAADHGFTVIEEIPNFSGGYQFKFSRPE